MGIAALHPSYGFDLQDGSPDVHRELMTRWRGRCLRERAIVPARAPAARRRQSDAEHQTSYPVAPPTDTTDNRIPHAELTGGRQVVTTDLLAFGNLVQSERRANSELPLHAHRDTHAAANAQRRQTFVCIALPHLMQ